MNPTVVDPIRMSVCPSKDSSNYDKKGLTDYFKGNYRGCLLKKAVEFDLFLRYVEDNQVKYAIESSHGPSNSAWVKRDDDAAYSCKIALTTNNYLGLSNDPRIIEAYKGALARYGTSSGGSPLLSGTLSAHKDLERELATFLDKDDAMLFTSGYAANLGIINALVGPNDYVIIDKLAHASIIDGLFLSRAKFTTFKHNDVSDLNLKLEQAPADAGILVIVDGVYSMQGNLAPLAEITRLKDKHNFVLLVDDAHAIGVLGRQGRGSADHFGVSERVDLIMGTMSKALSGTGGFVAGERTLLTYLRYFSRSSMFSSNISPAAAVGITEALRILQQSGDSLIGDLHRNCSYLRSGLHRNGLATKGDMLVPIINIPVGDDLLARNLCREMFDAGLLVNAIPTPVVPKNEACIRLRVTRLHTLDQLDTAIQIVRQAFAKAGLV